MKKGFTLIELLAVIVILAIIALIATPIVLNIINDTKENSLLRSAEFYLDAVEHAVAQSTLNDKKLANTLYKIIEDGNICIEYKDNKCINEFIVEVSGEVPSSGNIVLNNGKIYDLKLKYKNNKIIVYDDNKKLVYEKIGPYQENENIEVPDLSNNALTPVIYDGDNWKVADVTKKWYSYKDQQWANAVILNSEVKKNIGDIITVDGENPDALAMFVWIPRYEYKIEGLYGKGGTSASNPGEIEINFISKYQTIPSSDYKISPAFWWDNNNDNINEFTEQISGFWMGKFEPYHESCSGGYSIAYGCVKCSDINCSSSDEVRILPNKYALSNTGIGSMFYLFRSMSRPGNIFGLDFNIADTHLIKNSEWAAVSYLTQSKYGKYGNDNYTNKDKEVFVNNSWYTGRSGGSYSGNTPAKVVYPDQTSTSYNNEFGYYTYDGYLLEYNTNNKTNIRDLNKVSSTTGNIYGVYDMSGSNTEYVMGYYTEVESNEMNKIDLKYLHRYSSLIGVYDGHALSETAGWYNDNQGEFKTSHIYMSRGGSSSLISYSGIFAIESGNGGGHGNVGSRITLITVK